MGENNNNGNDNDNGGGDNNNNNNNNNNNKKKKEEPKSVTVVLKTDMHCEGCASKMVKTLRSFDGVETVKSDAAASKLTVTGFIDPSKIREKLQNKTKKKVELISPQPQKDKENNNNNNNNNNKNKQDNNKPMEKEPPVTSVVLKLSFHCQGCIDKIGKTVTKFNGVHNMIMDKPKELVTVKGTMDVKVLVEALKEKLKRPVEVVPPKKEKESGGGGGENGGGGKKKNGGGKEEGGSGGGGGKIVEGNRMEYMGPQGGYGFGYEYGYPYPDPMIEYGNQVELHAPQMFSEENPNACSVM